VNMTQLQSNLWPFVEVRSIQDFQMSTRPDSTSHSMCQVLLDGAKLFHHRLIIFGSLMAVWHGKALEKLISSINSMLELLVAVYL